MKNPKRQLLELKREQAIRKARTGMMEFTQYTNPDYRANWHHRLLCEYLDRFVAGEIRNLMVFMPPRHGKSELVSRRLPAYLFGKKPKTQLIACSYSSDLASMMNRDVQRIMDSEEYQHLFPHASLNASNVRSTAQGSYLRNSDVFEIVGEGGFYRSAGVGGGITGMGANYCFPSGVAIDTESGYRCISTLKVGENVWSYNHTTGQPELQEIEAVFSRRVPGLVQVTTADGDKVLCTPEHRIWTEEQGYREAQILKKDTLLVARRLPERKESNRTFKVQALWDSIRTASLRLRKIFKERMPRSLLFEQVFKAAPQLQKPPFVHHLQTTCRKKMEKILQHCLQARTKIWPNNKEVPLSECFQKNSGTNRNPRWRDLFRLPVKSPIACAPHQRGSTRRSPGKSNYNVQEMPFTAPQIERTTVSSVEPVSFGEVTVYDIQVRRNNNFFAQGILVHNCIIDDPIRNQQDANSQTIRENIWGWYTSTLYTRLQNPRSVLITLTRWHEDDLAGRLLQLAKEDPNADQWTVLKLPARFQTYDRNDRDPRNEGEALWEEDFGDKVLTSIQSSVGPIVWSALYQQAPSPASGGFFKSDMFEFCDLPLEFDYTFIMGDTAYNDRQENDYSVLGAYGVVGDKLYLIDILRERIKASDFEIPAISFIKKHTHYGFRGAYIEPKGHGIYLNQMLPRKGILMPSEDQAKLFYQDRRLNKTERASNIVPHLSTRKVYINKQIRIKEELLAEVTSFPKGTHDDFVDTLIDAVKFAFGLNDISILDVL